MGMIHKLKEPCTAFRLVTPPPPLSCTWAYDMIWYKTLRLVGPFKIYIKKLFVKITLNGNVP